MLRHDHPMEERKTWKKQSSYPLSLPSPPWGEDLSEGKKEIPIL
jgi:hypothetical protein